MDAAFLPIPAEPLTPLDYVSVREADKPPQERTTDHGYGTTVTVAAADGHQGGLCSHDLYRVSCGEQDGRPTVACELIPEALTRAEALDGYYVLETTRSATEADARALLAQWKGQWQIEQRHRSAKGPLRIRPLFVTSHQQIVGLITILGIALLVFSLIEREARRTLGAGVKLPGLLAGHVAARPTGENILKALQEVALVQVVVAGERHQRVADLSPLQRRLLSLNQVPETVHTRLAS